MGLRHWTYNSIPSVRSRCQRVDYGLHPGKPPSDRLSVSLSLPAAAWYTGGIAVAIAVPVSIHDILMHMLVSPSTHSTFFFTLLL
jgi:hypothetical protein